MAKKLGPLAKKVLAKVRRKPKAKAEPSPVEVLAAPAPVDLPAVMGRPSDYDPKFVTVAQVMCERGATDNELAEAFQISQRTLNRWKISYPDFAQALLRGKQATDQRVIMSLYHQAMGYEIEKEVPIKLKRTSFVDGKVSQVEEYVQTTTVKEFVPPVPTAAIFWAKNRMPKEWRDVHQVEHGRAGDFDTLSEDELRAIVVEETKAIAKADPVFAKQVLLLPQPNKKRSRG